MGAGTGVSDGCCGGEADLRVARGDEVRSLRKELMSVAGRDGDGVRRGGDGALSSAGMVVGRVEDGAEGGPPCYGPQEGSAKSSGGSQIASPGPEWRLVPGPALKRARG